MVDSRRFARSGIVLNLMREANGGSRGALTMAV
jgi:hypothetical protein